MRCEEYLRQIWLNYECKCVTGAINSSTGAPQHMPTATASPSASTNHIQTSALIVLGALLGVFVVLFVSVTAGWVWSCWASKRRATEMAQAQ